MNEFITLKTRYRSLDTLILEVRERRRTLESLQNVAVKYVNLDLPTYLFDWTRWTVERHIEIPADLRDLIQQEAVEIYKLESEYHTRRDRGEHH